MITVGDFKFLMKEIAKDMRAELRHVGGEDLGFFEYNLVLTLDDEELLMLPLLREGLDGEDWNLISVKEEK